MNPNESIIRKMTRLAIKNSAVNLSQGFTDESPPFELVWGGIAAILGGTDKNIERIESCTIKEALKKIPGDSRDVLSTHIKDVLAGLQDDHDLFNQYSFPFGLPELRQTISDYTERFHGFTPNPDTEITVVSGATEGLAVALRTLCKPNDGIIIVQPFHEMYPSQAKLFGLHPFYVNLRENLSANQWQLDEAELANAAKQGARVLILNTPHNPTGKVFTQDELRSIADICQTHDLLVITDEIYEHVIHVDRPHYCLARFDKMRERTLVVNSISKTGNATGWRVGWVLSPSSYTPTLRGIHDTLTMQAPTPLQKGAKQLLELSENFYQNISVSYQMKRDILMTGLQQAGFRITPPEGAYYLFADYRKIPKLKNLSPTQAAMFLIEEIGVAPVPGDNFYNISDGNASEQNHTHYLRFAFCRSIDTLREATNRLAALTANS